MSGFKVFTGSLGFQGGGGGVAFERAFNTMKSKWGSWLCILKQGG